jgi:hypothetical protein
MQDKSEEIARSIDGSKLPENPEERARAIYDLEINYIYA